MTAHSMRDKKNKNGSLVRDDAERAGARFFVQWLGSPRRIGAVAPSSRHLAKAMAREVAGIASGAIIELGGGTGSVTQGLLDEGIAPERLVVIERDPHLHAMLQKRFPQLRVLLGDAGHLKALLAPLGIESIAAIVSSLPLVSLPKQVRDAVLKESLELLDESAPFIQFTYSLAAPMAYQGYGLTGRVVARVWRNLPPASVWRFQRRV